MTSGNDAPSCEAARVEIGVDPEHASAALGAHLAGCEACRRYRDSMLKLNAGIRAALDLPLAPAATPAVDPLAKVVTLRRRPVPQRVWALAASLVLAIGAAFFLWPATQTPALARDLLAHLASGEETSSWDNTAIVADDTLDTVLQNSGVRIARDRLGDVVYAHRCQLRGRTVPHLVLRTVNGNLTVVPLAGEKLAAAEQFREGAYSGVLLPMTGGAVAVLARDNDVNLLQTAEAIRASLTLGAATP